MTKRIILTFVGLFILVGALGGIKALQIGRMVAQGEQYAPPPEAVTTAAVQQTEWERALTSVGSLDAVQGVMVTAELTGKVTRIAFKPGAKVKAGDLLLKQDTSSEEAQLREVEAALSLAKTNLARSKKLVADHIIAQSDFDKTNTEFIQASAKAETIKTLIGKKTIRAPFAGRLGIRMVNIGQNLKEGDPIVSLQSIDSIFVNFSLPQQYLADIQTGLAVRVTSDAFPEKVVEGKITTIDPQVDAATRNVRVQATVGNPEEVLRPGMYVNVSVVLPNTEKVDVIPATAVLYAPYSDSVFVVEARENDKTGASEKVVRQQFVQLGEKRGDMIAVVSGLKQSDTIVSTGAFKLRNGQKVAVDNSLAPDFKLAPKPENG